MRSLLVEAIRNPVSTTALSAAQWNRLLVQAQEHDLLARLGERLKDMELFDSIDERARLRLEDALVVAEHNQATMKFEINRVLHAIGRSAGPIILLKGSAFLAAGLPPWRGRIASDVDLLVPRAKLPEIEKALLAAGWRHVLERRYDRHYYETWMHEIAPLMHPEREMSVDVHHTIAPPTSRAHPDVEALWSASVEVVPEVLRILSPADMVLHGAVHLFNEDFRSGVRDLVDLHDLLSHFGRTDSFWLQLDSRARLHGLERVYFYLLRFTSGILGTEVPETIHARARAGAPPVGILQIMDVLVSRALIPDEPGTSGTLRDWALWCLYVRSHWLRMPPRLLLRHLSVKLWFRLRSWLPLGRPTPAL